MDLRANTAVDVLIGPFVDSTDGDTEETALTLAQADIKLSKNGQTLAQKSDITAAAHDANGYYNCELDATDTNTEGNLVLIVHESGALAVRHEYNVMAEAAWDSLYAAKDTGYMDVNVKAISEDTTAADNAELAFDGTGFGFTNCTIPTTTTVTNGVSLANGAVTDASLAGNMEIVFETDFATNYNTTRNAWVTNHTDYIGTIPAAALGADCITAAKIADDALVAANFATGAFTADAFAANALVAATFAASSLDGKGDWNTTTEMTAAFTEIKGATWASGTDTLEHIRDKQTDIETDTAEIGTAGAGLTNINLPNQTMDVTGNLSGSVGSVTGAVGSVTGNVGGNVVGTVGELATQAKADVNAEVDTALTDYDGPTNAEMIARTPSAAQLAYIVSNAATGMPVTFTTAGGSTTAAVINEVDGAAGSTTNDQYNGRLLVFIDGTLKGVVTDITDYVGSTTTATITAIPFAPTSSHNARLI